MRNLIYAVIILVFANGCYAQPNYSDVGYLDSLKTELRKKWPNNRMVNLVFHGHSVPTGYLTKGVVDRLGSYPFLSLKKIKEGYPYAVINVITTSIGGEQAEQGAKRFKEEVLNHKPDLLFIDYALNDRSIGLERAKTAWESMIQEAKTYGTKIILLTPTPDLTENILSDEAELEKHSEQIRQLAAKYQVGLVDSYALFKEIAKTEDLKSYMAQKNHVNEKGHKVVAEVIVAFFENNK